MPVPAVSPRNWKRTEIVCHFVMGPPMSLTNELSFQSKLETILDSMDGGTIEETRENQEHNNDDRKGTYYSGAFEDEIEPDSPYVVHADTRDRDDDHRPRVEENVVEDLEKTLTDEKPSVPAEKLDFDSKLGVLLDVKENYYETLQCEVSVFA
jgi:hypothetical protein